MNRYFTVMCVVAICGTSMRGADTVPPTGPTVGTVYRGELYCIKMGRATEFGTMMCRLLREPLLKMQSDGLPKERVEFVGSLDGVGAGLPIRWRISNGVLWNITDGVETGADMFRIKVIDLDLFDANDPKKEDKWDERIRKNMRPEDTGYVFSWFVSSAIGRATELEKELYDEEIRQGKKIDQIDVGKIADRIRREIAFVDFLPTSPISGREFLLEKGKCQVWSVLAEYSRGGDTKKALAWRQTYSKDPVAIIDLGFTEPFTVFSHNGAYFFLTRSCKLYSAKKDADDKWKVEKLWSEANRPIHAVITDTATNKSYAFTQAKPNKDGKKARDVYFEFDAKLAPVEFDRAKIKPFQLDPPLNTLREYTQVLIDARKIDPTPPKKKE